MGQQHKVVERVRILSSLIEEIKPQEIDTA